MGGLFYETRQHGTAAIGKTAFNAEELCRPIDGTPFHNQCLNSSVVKQKGFIPRHLRPPWLNSSLFEDNELSEEKVKHDGCYGCYKGTNASNGMAPGEEYCACTGRVQEMRGLQLDLQTINAVQWRDPAGGYEYSNQTQLNWQPTDLKLMKQNGMPDGTLMYPTNFVLRPVGQLEFVMDLFKHIYLHKNPEIYTSTTEDTVVAPQLAAIGLAIAYNGARGNTKAQIGKVLLDEDSSEQLMHNNNRQFLQKIQLIPSNDVFKLKMESKMFLSDSFDVLDQFKTKTNSFYGNNFEKINFREATEAANKINEFARKITAEGNVSDVIQPADIEPHQTKIIIVNVAHFHTNWGPLIGQFIYKNEEKFRFIGVPIGSDNDQLHLAIVVPNNQLDLSVVIKEFKSFKLFDLLTKSPKTEAKLILPPIKIDIFYEFENVLPSLGIKNAFNQSTADFTGMNKSVPSLFINKFIHKVSFSIANGTDTHFQCDDRRLYRLPGFEADESFAFFLVHNKKNIRFAGSVGIKRRYYKKCS
ncbi:hypothetical protein niasHT_038544 [Heterodera trifolii]|uniref:Serpin domain-containing protein n=1 Tax=Heterodera trifolii TaxID=157864 RepID=A0ABD2I7I4_9BILA